MTNVECLRQMAFRGRIYRWFTKSKYDFLLVFHYNHWCISLNNEVIGYVRTFSFSFNGISLLGQILKILTLLHYILTLQILKRHILTPNDVFWAIVGLHQNPLRIVVCSLINETRRKNSKSAHFTHIGRSPRRTNLNQIWQFSLSHWGNQSFKIWCWLVWQFRLWRGANLPFSIGTTTGPYHCSAITLARLHVINMYT